MKFSCLPEIKDNKYIALIGSGGKTAAMISLGQEFILEEQKVLLTTTTRIYPPEGMGLSLSQSLSELKSQVERGLKEKNLLVAGYGKESGKVVGVPPDWLHSLGTIPGLARVIFEADGAAGRPLKFPAPYEPCLPGANDLLILLLVGIKGVGRPLKRDIFHRPELACQHLKWTPGQIITPEMVVDLILHPQSYGRIVSHYPTLIFFNQVETTEEIKKARVIGERVVAAGKVKGGVIAFLRGNGKIHELIKG